MTIFSLYDEPALKDYLRLAAQFKAIDEAQAFDLALAAIRYYRGDASQRSVLRAGQLLEDRWYASLRAGEPDYAIYDDEFFVSDVWACWVVYSRKYLRQLVAPTTRYETTQGSLLALFENVRSVADLGCGIGYTTAGLKELFPRADVYGTQLPNTFQFNVAREIGHTRGFTIRGVVDQQTDLIFASEYFEHFQHPIEHLLQVISTAAPKYLILASAFGSRSIGHFDEYLVGGVKIPNTSIGRTFNQALRMQGYTQVKTSLWNNRPAIWKKHGR